MKTLSLRYVSLVACLFLFFIVSSCSKFGDKVSLSGRNFEDEIQQTQNLVFTFSHDLVRESDLNTWESRPFVEFSPKVEGKFKWTSPSELVFSPAVGFDPATEYKAEFSKIILDKAEKKYSLDAENVAFHTPFLKLENVESYWSKSREDGKAVAKLKLKFNYAVNPQVIAKSLKIKERDNELPFQIIQTNAASEIDVQVKEVGEGEAKTLSVVLEKGLSLPNSKYESTEELTSDVSLPDVKTLTVVEVEHSFAENAGFIKVVMNQAIKSENLKDIYSISVNNSGSSENPQEDIQEESITTYDTLGNPIVTIRPITKQKKKQTPKLSTKAELTDNGFIIKGDFNENDSYTLTINKNAQGVLGASLSDDYVKDIFFGDMPASISFVNKKAIYLSSKGNKNIAVNVVNVPKVNVKISKIYENNILAFLRQNRYQDYENYDEEGGGNGQVYNYSDDGGTFSDEIVNKTIETENLPKSRGVRALNLSLPAQNSIKGIYLVNLNSNDEYYLNASKLVSLSDIGLITKEGDDEVFVFANSIKTAEPLADVEITMISSNNQTIATAKTDSKGVVSFKDYKKTGFKLALITAHQEDDFNYLLMESSMVETSRFDVEGKRKSETGFDAFIYGDRDIYRPGETVNFNTIIRNPKWESVGAIPLKISLLLPNGKEFKTFRKETNAQGAVSLSIPTDRSSVTGSYVIEVKNANDVLLASKSVAIEEFMPDRIKVDVKASKEFYKNGDDVQISATATNLFGPPAAGRNYQMDFQVSRSYYSAKGYENYVFDINDNTTFETVAREGVTDEKGNANESFPIAVTYADMGVLEGKAYVTVFDETGRPVNRLQRLAIYTQSVFYGIGMPDTYVATQRPVQIPLVALNKDGKPVSAKGHVEVLRYEYQTVIERNSDNSMKYTSKKLSKTVFNRAVSFSNGQANVNFNPGISGEYEVRVHREGASSWTSQYFYAYSWGRTENTSFEVNNEGQVTMTFDKEKYKVGDNAKVLFKTPFAGKLLVTIERNHVLEHHYIQTDKKSAELSFSVGKEHLPNVYVSATLIRPMDESNLPLTVAHGYAPMMVEDTDNQIPIEIVAVEKSRSKTKQKITIKTKANTQVTIAVVDEGILQLKNFQTPNPYDYFYSKQALEVSGYDLYPFLFPEFSIAGSSSTGGDGYNLEKRVNPLNNGRVNLVSYWSGIKETDFGGEAEFEFDIPQFSGDLRIMVIAYKDEAFGSANKNMKVADPLVLSTALPRFASPNDELIVPVSITNTTKSAANVTATISTTGTLAFVGDRSQTISIPAEKEGRAYFNVKAASAVGNGTVTVSVGGTMAGRKENFTEKIELGVRPTTSLLKVANSGVINNTQTMNIDMGTADFIPSSIKNSLVISKSPMVQFIDKFENLLGYPHGCVEQTTSKAFPQLYFEDFVKNIQKGKKPQLKSGENELNPKFNVQEAINKLGSMVLPSGGLSYWQGGETESWWGSAYACHFLIEAQKADYEVNPSVIGRILEYLTVQSNSQTTEKDYYYDKNNSLTYRTIADRSTIYSLYVLSLSGKPNRSVMNYYKSNQNLLTTDEKYLLALTFNKIGDTKSYAAIVPKNFVDERYSRQTGGSFSSPIRNQALVLNALIDGDPKNIQIPILARNLSQAIKIEPWLSTQEEAFAFLALGKLARKAAATNMTASVASGGKTVGNFTGTDLTLTKIANPSSISTKGSGSLYYFSQSEGLSMTGKVQETDNVLRVRREYYSRAGQPLGQPNFKQNQLIVVRITLTSSLPVENVVITDMLPAGLEIENPRLTADRDLVWIKDQANPDHFDIRDDRINFFTDANATNKSFYYLVRAVSKGKFTRGPVSADAMYNGEYRSYNGAGIVTVQ